MTGTYVPGQAGQVSRDKGTGQHPPLGGVLSRCPLKESRGKVRSDSVEKSDAESGPEPTCRKPQTGVCGTVTGAEVTTRPPALVEELAQLLASALVADYMGAIDGDGSFPLETKPKGEAA